MSHFSHRLEVRFRDCDSFGHTNNAVYLTFLEQARFAHWRSLWGFGTLQLPPGFPGVILARAEADYKRPSRAGSCTSAFRTGSADPSPTTTGRSRRA